MKKIKALFLFIILGTGSLKAQEVQPTSKIVFIRTFNYFGCAIGYNVFEGKTKVIRMKPQTLATIDMPAKPTRLWAKTEVEKHVDLDLKPNYIYFVRCKAALGLFLYRPSFETLTVEEFKNLVAEKPFLQKKIKQLGFETVDDFLKSYQSIRVSSL